MKTLNWEEAQSYIDQLELMAQNMHDESPEFRKYPLQHNVVGRFIEAISLEHYVGTFLFDDTANKMAGFVIGYIQESPIVKMKCLYETLLYLAPVYRTYEHASLLVDEFENIGSIEGVDKIYLSTASGIKPGNTCLLYQKLGFEIKGVITAKELEYGN